MHERERQRMILSVVQARSVATVQELSRLTEASEATLRRDIAALALKKKLKRVRGESAQLLPVLQVKSGAEGGDRTRTGLRPQDFKSRVS